MIQTTSKKMPNILAFRNPKGYTDVSQIEEQIVTTTSAVKIIMSVAHAMVLFTMLDTLDKIKSAKWYDKNKRLFKIAKKVMDNYDKGLLHATTNRFFCVKDMSEQLRATYNDNLTDRQYFEYWLDMGASYYDKIKPFILLMQNKYRLVLHDMGITDENATSWAITTEFALEEAEAMYKDGVLKAMSEKIGVPEKILDCIYSSFRFDDIHKAWQRAIKSSIPELQEIADNAMKSRNVLLGINDFHSHVADVFTSCEPIMQATEDNEDLWAGKDEFKKAKRLMRSVQKKITQQGIGD